MYPCNSRSLTLPTTLAYPLFSTLFHSYSTPTQLNPLKSTLLYSKLLKVLALYWTHAALLHSTQLTRCYMILPYLPIYSYFSKLIRLYPTPPLLHPTLFQCVVFADHWRSSVLTLQKLLYTHVTTQHMYLVACFHFQHQTHERNLRETWKLWMACLNFHSVERDASICPSVFIALFWNTFCGGQGL